MCYNRFVTYYEAFEIVHRFTANNFATIQAGPVNRDKEPFLFKREERIALTLLLLSN